MNIAGIILPKLSVGKIYIYLSITIFSFIILALISCSWQKSQPITKIEIVESSFVPKSEIIEILEQEIIGKEIEFLNLDYLEKLACNHPFVLGCDIFLDGRNRLIIKPQLRNPIGVYVNEVGRYLIDDLGAVLPIHKNIQLNDKILLSGITHSSKNENFEKQIKEASKILRELVKSKNYDIEGYISELRYNKFISGFVMLDNISGNEIIFGNAEDIDAKVERMKMLFRNKSLLKERDNLAYADLRFSERIIIKNEIKN